MEVGGIRDLFREGMNAGWQVSHAGLLKANQVVECDVVIVGTGAGGGTAAEILAQAGLKVVMLEEGPLRTSNDFRMDEREAYRELYQEGAARTTKDGSIIILQGRSVGGSTTVNWTSSFRTPEPTLKQWAEVHGVKGLGVAELAPWFERMEKRLNIAPWLVPPNANNDVIAQGCGKLGLSWQTIPRNVNGCWNLGYCGLGCPTNAKQGMLVTTIPEALKRNAQLYYRARVESLLLEGDQVAGVYALGLRDDGLFTSGVSLTVRARHTILAGGGINTPGIMLRSKLADPHRTIGKRTFLHPVNASFARFPRQIDPFYGAPQSLYSDHFQWKDGATGPMGYKLEVMPLQPGLTAALLGTFGEAHAQDMRELSRLNCMIALQRDGFSEDSPGGTVALRGDGSPVVDYPMSDSLADGIRRAYASMAEIQFAAGAREVRPNQLEGRYYRSWAECREAIKTFKIEKFRTKIGCAHVMGGCAMGEDAKQSVVNSRGEFHHLGRLSVMDGSLFPTSIGANPQLSIYGLVAKLASELAAQLVPKAA